MATADYTELDKLILARIECSDKPPTFMRLCGLLGSEAEKLATPDRWSVRNGWRIIDRRLQALRKSGKITFVNKAWHLT